MSTFVVVGTRNRFVSKEDAMNGTGISAMIFVMMIVSMVQCRLDRDVRRYWVKTEKT